MTIFCKLCRRKFFSLGPPTDIDRNTEQVLRQLAIHFQQCHKPETNTLSDLMDAAAKLYLSYAMIQRYAEVPPEETDFPKAVKELELSLLELFGIQPQTVD